jgi:hypothetical protein
MYGSTLTLHYKNKEFIIYSCTDPLHYSFFIFQRAIIVACICKNLFFSALQNPLYFGSNPSILCNHDFVCSVMQDTVREFGLIVENAKTQISFATVKESANLL